MKDYTGLKNNFLTAIHFSKREKRKTYWIFKCKCGKHVEKIIDNVLSKGRENTNCGCDKSRSYNKTEEQLKYKTLKVLYNKYERNSTRRNHNFDLTIHDFKKIINSNCFYCGSSPENKFYDPNHINIFILYNGIDRKHNNEGYTINNCVTCCKNCNYAKRDLDYDIFINWINRLKMHTIK